MMMALFEWFRGVTFNGRLKSAHLQFDENIILCGVRSVKKEIRLYPLAKSMRIRSMTSNSGSTRLYVHLYALNLVADYIFILVLKLHIHCI